MSMRSPFTTAIERGAYSVTVFIDGDLFVAEDEVGTTLKESTVGGTAIQAAIDYLPALGGDILVGTGYFGVTTPLQMKSYANLEGLGPRSTIITGKAIMNSVISFASGTQHTQANIRNLRIDNDPTYAVTSLIDAYNLEFSTFENLYICGTGYGMKLRINESGKTAYVNQLINVYAQMAAAADEVLLMTSPDNKILGCTFFEGKGVQIGEGGNYNLMSGTHIAGSSTYGLYVANALGGRILGNEIENNSGIGIFFYRSSVGNQWTTVADNNLYLNTTRDFHADNVKAMTIRGNTCASALASSITTINSSDYNIVVGNATDGAVTLVGANNEEAHNIQV